MSRFVSSGICAVQLNSGINLAHLLCYLACNALCLAKARDKIEALIARFNPNSNAEKGHGMRYGRKYGKEEEKEENASVRLSRVPGAAWVDADNDFPVLDTAYREAIRLMRIGAASRYNDLGASILIASGGQVIPAGSFATYHIGDAHYDPAIYADPNAWNPDRWLEHAPGVSRASQEFLGWGRGLHPCLGRSLAQREAALVVAHFVLRFDFALCDEEGSVLGEVPLPDRNALNSERPKMPLNLRVRERVEA